MDLSYWKKQQAGKALFPDIEWNRPERRDQAGKLLIVGGNKLGFASVGDAYETAKEAGAGSVRVLLPDCLKNVVPKTISDVVFAACNQSGSLSGEAASELRAASAWADGVLLIGDAGRNAETAVVYESFIQDYAGALTITRDAVDLIRNNPNLIVERENTLIVASFAQMQKLLAGVYYPRMVTFSMQLLQLVETLHKFTISYPCTIMTLHKDTLIIANGGEVITQVWDNPMAIWRGSVAARAASYWLWNPAKTIESVTSSIVK